MPHIYPEEHRTHTQNRTLQDWRNKLEAARAYKPVTRLYIEMNEHHIEFVLKTIERLEAEACHS
jgi:hypothetical protein